MTARRTLGAGPQAAHTIRAAQADLIDDLPSLHLPDIAELRARGVLGGSPTQTVPVLRRALAADGLANKEPAT
ncbi:hypothetical protein [Streptomyces sp. NPDC055912]|uniref:hypothetical protein n=1 Tax=Streptomyces sp. NPDC055912 TaxID=3345660 RepID=UPI0035D57FC7